ncbi:collagen-like protein [Mucilaginibacter phyllosphaerae]|uniref:Collagen-like protein n=1 Tax=Mucilaginibacter phyllosphaerae TaxID=1812349 RepID=A0A4Y8AJN3_9SPHI|nr:collagen-like protein [Mucilaginibacter phyllosphaerae]MBB3967723.1 hypothetical protein [Mucilaginibacter phyllosphaerae]TEW69224.1 collagen-like protein [Mucilaginibacter phyllosphaerae]GGH03761.1 hypothetical protein GCM10007352_06560 [Mucilaginibacter phyllosphaerae]
MATDKKISELPVTQAVSAADVSVLVRNGVDYQYSFTSLLEFVNSGVNSGVAISFGTIMPQNNSGKNGDLFINTLSGTFCQKISGSWVIKYTLPSPGDQKDGTVLYGSGIPGTVTGGNNDTYINIDTGIFYKKSNNAWLQVFSMQTGPQGPKGDKGDTGLTGANGKTILSGTANPSNSTGTDGDFYLNTNSLLLFGPKTAGIWGNGVPIVGIQGEQGEPGLQGPAGPTGAIGAKGDKGDAGAKGPDGNNGAIGLTGPKGDAGPGIKNGGITGQVLAKISDDDYDTGWVDAGSGGGGGEILTATEATAGIVALATLTQALARTEDTKAMTSLKTIALILDEKKKVSYQINPVSLTEVSLLMEFAGQINSVLLSGATNVKLKIGIAGSYASTTQSYPFHYAAGDRVFITYTYTDQFNASCNIKLKCQDN